MSNIFSVNQIIGKTLIAAKEVKIVRTPADNAPSVYTVKKGQVVGVVYSYLEPNTSRSSLYWMMLDYLGKPFYVKHESGLFSVKGLYEQGAIDVEQEAEKKEEKEKGTIEQLQDLVGQAGKYGVLAIGIWGGVTIGKTLLNNRKG